MSGSTNYVHFIKVSSLEERLEKVKELYELAQRQIKQLEMMGAGLDVPAINQLRYVGEHILHASTANTEKEKTKHLDSAEQHCWRAIRDGTELGSIFALEKLRDFQEEYRGVTVTEYIPEYREIIDLAVKLQSVLAQSHDIDPRTYYLEVNKYLPLLMDKLSIVEKTRDILHKKLKSKQKTTRSWLLGVFVSIIVSMVSGVLFQSIHTEKTADLTIQSEIENLDSIQKSLTNLQSYISSQKVRLEGINKDISSLTSKREELEKVVSLNEDTVQALLSNYESNQSSFSILGIGISFVVGCLSSFFVVLLVGFLKRKKLLKNT